MVAKLAKLGIVPGKPFDASKLGDEAAKALADVPKLGLKKLWGTSRRRGHDGERMDVHDKDRPLRH